VWFSVSWSDWGAEADEAEFLDDPEDVMSAEDAIGWGRVRATTILIRLAHSRESYYSAGDVPGSIDEDQTPLPVWPPATPAEGWWQQSAEEDQDGWLLQTPAAPRPGALWELTIHRAAVQQSRDTYIERMLHALAADPMVLDADCRPALSPPRLSAFPQIMSDDEQLPDETAAALDAARQRQPLDEPPGFNSAR
jgi:hypothetical protein